MKNLQQKIKRNCLLLPLLTVAFLLGAQLAKAQYPPSHDPTTMIRNVDGRYWIFTTGQGVWAMSSSNPDFTDWRVEPTPFPSNWWPSWISNYVSGFNGFFWAPEVIKIGNTYHLYYSCAGQGAPAAIGLATATNLAGPWTDRGMVVAGNNAIDPALLYDNGRLWMTWGNWQSGIDICELSPQTGKRISGITQLVGGQVEGPALLKNRGYYYLFYQRGLCCDGLNSTYYIVVARSTNVTGPYTNERVFLPNRNGNIVGPGHIGYGEGRLTYHFYDGNDNGNAKLMVRSDYGYANGWPYLGTPPPPEGPVHGGVYHIEPRHSSKAIDVENCGTGEDTNVRQWTWLNNNCQKWVFSDAGGGSWRISPLNAPSQALDLTNCDGANLANMRLWSWLNNDCQKWDLINRGQGYYSIRSRASGKCLDISGASNADGANLIQYTCNSNSYNQQFRLHAASSRTATQDSLMTAVVKSVKIFPNPVADYLEINLGELNAGITDLKLFNTSGQLIKQEEFEGQKFSWKVSDVNKGMYIIQVENFQGTNSFKIQKN